LRGQADREHMVRKYLCGASLTVPMDIGRLNCTNCGTELALIQGEGLSKSFFDLCNKASK
jgi:hypothetical protein